jgi:hypothetical protein
MSKLELSPVNNPASTYEVDAPIAGPNEEDGKVLLSVTPALTPGIGGNHLGSKSPTLSALKQTPSGRLLPLHSVSTIR